MREVIYPKLKDCPLCGSPCRIEKFDWAHGRCNEGTGLKIRCICGLELKTEKEYGLDELHEKWNQRI